VHSPIEVKGKADDREGRHGPAPDAIDQTERVDDQRLLRCAACGAVVTTWAAKVSVHGAFEHRRVNPSGVDFHLGCFGEAPGCFGEGAPTLFWTWFPGYAWQIASCRRCREHLGWVFHGETTFYGLILSRLKEG
jgi:hypothetical protein